MASAETTGRGGVQVQLNVHGVAIDPLNIEPAKDLWASLGRAIAQAERNAAELVANDDVAEGAPPEAEAEAEPPAESPPQAEAEAEPEPAKPKRRARAKVSK